MEYHDWTPEAVAALFEKHGITPERGLTYSRWMGSTYGCPVACLAREAGVLAEDVADVWMLDLTDALNDYPTDWLYGILHGFDYAGQPPWWCGPDEPRGPEYDAGLALGTAVAARVFAAVAV